MRGFAEESALITVFMGKTAGLSWELNLVASSGYLHKKVFLMPLVNVEEMALRLAVFAETYDLPTELLDTQTVRRVPLRSAGRSDRRSCWWCPQVPPTTSATKSPFSVASPHCRATSTPNPLAPA